MTQSAADHFRAVGRHPADLPVRVTPRGRDESHAVRMLDLGLGGACLEIAERYERGELLTLQIELPGLWDPLVVDAEVAWCEPRPQGPTRAGVHFTGMTGRQLRLIAEAL